MPSAYQAGSTNFPVVVLWRNGSVFDFGTSTTAIMAASAWVPLLSTNVTSAAAMATLSSNLSLTVPAGGRVALWFYFQDGNKPTRDGSVKTSATTSMPTFNSTSDGALSVSYAMQARARACVRQPLPGCGVKPCWQLQGRARGTPLAHPTADHAAARRAGKHLVDGQLGEPVPLERRVYVLPRQRVLVLHRRRVAARQRQRRPHARRHCGVRACGDALRRASLVSSAVVMHGSLLHAATHRRSAPVTLTSLSWLMPAAFGSSGTYFPVTVYARAGSVFDFSTSTTAIMAPAVWTTLLSVNVATTNTMALLSSNLSVAVPANGRVALWFVFTDGSKPARDATVKLSATTSMPNFTTTADGALTFTYAMQARATPPTAAACRALTHPGIRLCAAGELHDNRQLGQPLQMERRARLLLRQHGRRRPRRCTGAFFVVVINASRKFVVTDEQPALFAPVSRFPPSGVVAAA